MLEIYDKALYDNLVGVLNKKSEKNIAVTIIGVEKVGGLPAKIASGQIKYPIIALSRDKEAPIKKDVKSAFNSEENEGNEKVIPILLPYALTIITNNTDDMNEVFNNLLSQYSQTQFLTFSLPIESKREKRFGVSIDLNSNIERSSGEHPSFGKMYQTIIPLKSEGCLFVLSDETETVKKALDLTNKLSKYNKDGKEVKDGLEVIPAELLSAKLFLKLQKRPTAPVKTVIERVYPEIIVNTPNNILTMFSTARQARRAAEIAAVQASPEYQAKCAELNRMYYAQEQEVEKKYQVEKKEYDEVTLPAYKTKYAEAKSAVDAYYKRNKQHIANIQSELDKLFTETKMIPRPYRNVDALQYIYGILSTSNYDIKTAFEMYDRYLQNKLNEKRIRLEEEKLREQQRANAFFEQQQAAQYEATENQNSENSGGNLISDVFKTAAGVALGNKVSNRREEKSGPAGGHWKGSPQCQYPHCYGVGSKHIDICPLLYECKDK